MTKGPELKFSDKFDDVIDKLCDEKDPAAKKINAMKGLPTSINGSPLTLLDVSKSDFSFDMTVNGDVQTIKIAKFFKWFLSDHGLGERQIYNFAVSYNKAKNSVPKRKVPDITIGGWNSRDGFRGSSGSTHVPTPRSSYRGYSSSRPYSSDSAYGEDDDFFPMFRWRNRNADRLKDAEQITVPEFRFDPMNIRSTFISLVTRTYPHGTEEDVVPFITPGLTKDEFGNYYTVIGKSTSMFTCHLDTASRQQNNIVLYRKEIEGDEHIMTDGNSILGADDKSGVVVLMHMIANNIPGVYYFFIGEERGGIGSRKVAAAYDSFPHLKGMKRCVSFDRRNYHSVITEQLGRQCCSNEFAASLAKELNKNGMRMSNDPTGVYTDSASFTDEIPECTNVSVGYFNEHMDDESQNLGHLQRLCSAVLSVKWETLPVVRRVGVSQYLMSKYRPLLMAIKDTAFNMEKKMTSAPDRIFVNFELDEPNIDLIHEDLINLSILLSKHKVDPDISFDEQFIKIELK